MAEQPLILVTNDDGITAPGIHALAQEMKAFGRVLVVAPDKPQSAMGHAITIHDYLRLNKVDMMEGVEAYACSGTPVDCVKLAVYHVIKGRPALLVSGVNHGSNISINVLYSGTMSAAVEGAMEGIPSIGFSLMDHSIEARFEHVRPTIRNAVGNVLERGLPRGSCLNVNIPRETAEPLKGMRVCRQAWGFWEDDFEARKDPMGKDYFWLRGRFKDMDHGEDTDVWAVNNGYASVVPVQFDMTAHHAIAELNTWDHARLIPHHTPLDSVPLGFILGLLFPVLGFFGYGGIYVTAIRPHHDIHWFVYDLFLSTGEYRSQIISLSLIADAFLFFGFDHFEKYKSMRGVIAAMLLYAIVVVAFLF